MTESATFGSTGAMAETLVWLLVIVGVIVLLGWAVRRFTNIGPQGAGGMRVLSALPVGNRERIALVQVGDKQLLIGIAPGRVNTLHVFDEKVVIEKSASPVQGQSRGFSTILRNTLQNSQNASKENH